MTAVVCCCSHHSWRLTAQHRWHGKEASAATLASPSVHVLTLCLGLPGLTGTALPARATCCADCLTGACNDAGLPYAWINLQHGLLADDSTETNTAAAGSFTLELGLLSRLTGDHSGGPFCAALCGSKPDLPLDAVHLAARGLPFLQWHAAVQSCRTRIPAGGEAAKLHAPHGAPDVSAKARAARTPPQACLHAQETAVVKPAPCSIAVRSTTSAWGLGT